MPGSVGPVFRAWWATSSDSVGATPSPRGRRGLVRPATVAHSQDPCTLEAEAGALQVQGQPRWNIKTTLKAQWYTPVTLVLWKQRQEDGKLEASLGYT